MPNLGRGGRKELEGASDDDPTIMIYRISGSSLLKQRHEDDRHIWPVDWTKPFLMQCGWVEASFSHNNVVRSVVVLTTTLAAFKKKPQKFSNFNNGI